MGDETDDQLHASALRELHRRGLDSTAAIFTPSPKSTPGKKRGPRPKRCSLEPLPAEPKFDSAAKAPGQLVRISFQVTYPVRQDQRLVVIGSHEVLGSWDVMNAIQMTRRGTTNEFFVEVWLEERIQFDYKYLVLGGKGEPTIVWSSDPKSRVSQANGASEAVQVQLSSCNEIRTQVSDNIGGAEPSAAEHARMTKEKEQSDAIERNRKALQERELEAQDKLKTQKIMHEQIDTQKDATIRELKNKLDTMDEQRRFEAAARDADLQLLRGKLSEAGEMREKVERAKHETEAKLNELSGDAAKEAQKMRLEFDLEIESAKIEASKDSQGEKAARAEAASWKQKSEQEHSRAEASEIKCAAVEADKGTAVQRLEEQMEQASECLQSERTKVAELQSELETGTETNQALQADADAKSVQLKELAIKQQQAADELRDGLEQLKQQSKAQIAQVAMEEATKVQAAFQHMMSQFSQVQDKCEKLNTERRKLHNEVMELKGNIRVFCRIRPAKAGGEKECVQPSGETRSTLTTLDTTNPKAKCQSFEYDHVFGPETTNTEVFQEVEPLVTSVLDGFNGCIFAYGQTGSGKTHTMMGSAEQPGVNIMALQTLFNETAQCRERKFSLSVSLMEVYNETVRDLLSTEEKGKNMSISDGKNGLGNHCPDAAVLPVNSLDDVLQLMKTGNENRATASTNCNEHSSRSHCILSVYIKGEHVETRTSHLSILHLVDLAGSERLSKSGAVGDRANEAKNINKSLSALGDVVMALFNKSGHVPYRNSKLTFLLQDALGGNSKTLMMMQVSPTTPDLSESLCTLKFAQRVRGVSVGPASKNGQMGELIKLKEEVTNLKQAVSSKNSELKEQSKELKEMQSKAGAAQDMASSKVARVEKDLQKQLDQTDKQLSKANADKLALEESVSSLKDKLHSAESTKKDQVASKKGDAERYSVLEAKYDKVLHQNKEMTSKVQESSNKGAEVGAKYDKLTNQNAELAAKCDESSRAITELKCNYAEAQSASEQLAVQAEASAQREAALEAKIAVLIEQQAQQLALQSEACDSPQMSPSDKSFVTLFGEKAIESGRSSRHGSSPKRTSGEFRLPESPVRKSRRKSSLTPRRHSAANEEPTSPFVAWTDSKEMPLAIDELSVPLEKENGGTASPRIRSARKRLSTAPARPAAATAQAAAAQARVNRTKAADRRKSTAYKAQRVPIKPAVQRARLVDKAARRVGTKPALTGEEPPRMRF